MEIQDGIYAAYIAGKEGEGVVFLIFKNSLIVGCDLGGFNFDGSYSIDRERSLHDISLKVTAPPNRNTIQGQTTGLSGLKYEINFVVPFDFESRPFLSIMTPNGPINLRLEKIRDLGVLAE